MSVFETIRDQVTLDRILSANGSGKAHCVVPGHQDANPSMHLYDDHVHCFSCGFHGDVTDVWAAMRGFGRPVEAALDLARQFRIELPEVGPEAHKKAQERRDKEDLYLRQTRACHRALEKHPRVREWWENRGFDQELRERFLLGAIKDGTAAVIPFWHRGRVQGLIRRPLDGKPDKYLLPRAEELPDGHKRLFIPGPVRPGVFLVEGYIDALAVAALGESVVAIGGTGISEAQLRELERIPGPLYILPDADEAGAEAARKWARGLYPRAMICKADYGGEGREDAADLFAAVGVEEVAEHLERLVGTSEDLIDVETRAASELDGPRRKLAYATEHIIPLAARISPESARAAALDIVASNLKSVKVAWLKAALKEEIEHLEGERMAALAQEAAKEQERRAEDHRQKIADLQDEIDALFKPGVLGRLREKAAEVHQVERDEKPLEMAILVAVSAQLANLPNGRPSGTSALLTADAGRGKNHLADAAVELLPEEFYLTFEIASGQSLYYAAAEDSGFLKHRFVYPNEIEGVEALIEFLRPMLSKGWCRKFVTDKDPVTGRNVLREIIVEGPATTIIPTVRNKTDDQLQTRLLMAELEDYVGRVKIHSKAISDLYRPDRASADFSHDRFLWREGLRQLTTTRRVVFPLKHPDFAFDDDQVSHGARLWANLLGLMSAHAWLEQRHRRIVDLAEGGRAIEAAPEDYAAAYAIFTSVCERTVINLSDTHRNILDALYELRDESPLRGGFTTREVASKAGCSPQTVSNNKAFLSMSAKLIKETEDGISLLPGADPEEWRSGDLTKGLPSPEKVRTWWEEQNPPPDSPDGHKTTGQAGQGAETGDKADTYAENPVQGVAGQALDTSILLRGDALDPTGRVQPLSKEALDSENGISKPNTGHIEGLSSVSSDSQGSSGKENGRRRLTPEQVQRYNRLKAEGMMSELALAAVRGEKMEL